MPGLWIKICGMTTAGDIEVAAGAGADALGFVFHEASPRNLSPAAAQRLQSAVPAGVERVAVFLHPAQALVDAVLASVQPDWVQTDLEDLATLSLPAGQRVLPVLRTGKFVKCGSEPNYRGASKFSSEPNFPEPGFQGAHRKGAHFPARVLFESGRSGGGERADWDAARALAGQSELVLAGGLDAENVAEAVRTVRPFGVDVSSGVERSRGVKDPARIREFLWAARAASAALPGQEA